MNSITFRTTKNMKLVEIIDNAQSGVSFPYVHKSLPNKNKIREKNGKLLGAAILDTCMRKEHGSSQYLRALLQEVCITFDDDSTSCSSINLTIAVQPINVITNSTMPDPFRNSNRNLSIRANQESSDLPYMNYVSRLFDEIPSAIEEKMLLLLATKTR